MRNKISKIVLLLLTSAVGSVQSEQLPALEKPAANLSEKWGTNDSGWGVETYSAARCGWTNQALGVCLLQDPGDGFAHQLKLVGKLTASQGIFIGDYSRIEAFAFDLQKNNLTLSPVLYFKAISGAIWQYSLMGIGENGQKSSVSIPFAYSAKWSGGNESYFNIDKTNITEVGFLLNRGANDVNAQDFSVDNFKLVGAWRGPFSNGVPLAWLMEYGLTNDFATAGEANSDGDAFSNADEFLAGTDPVNSNSFFKIRIERNDKGKMVVRWVGNRDVKYSLLETDNLSGNNGFFEKTNMIPNTVKTEEVEVDQVESSTKFYKVVISTNPVAPLN